jgi:hypothetical protein
MVTGTDLYRTTCRAASDPAEKDPVATASPTAADDPDEHPATGISFPHTVITTTNSFSTVPTLYPSHYYQSEYRSSNFEPRPTATAPHSIPVIHSKNSATDAANIHASINPVGPSATSHLANITNSFSQLPNAYEPTSHYINTVNEHSTTSPVREKSAMFPSPPAQTATFPSAHGQQSSSFPSLYAPPDNYPSARVPESTSPTAHLPQSSYPSANARPAAGETVHVSPLCPAPLDVRVPPVQEKLRYGIYFFLYPYLYYNFSLTKITVSSDILLPVLSLLRFLMVYFPYR